MRISDWSSDVCSSDLDEEWDLLGPVETGDGRVYHCESHPQFQLKLLLDHMGVGRGEVTRWRWGGGRDAPAARTRAVEAAMTPAETTGKWQDMSARDRRIPGVRFFEVATPGEEAEAKSGRASSREGVWRNV